MNFKSSLVVDRWQWQTPNVAVGYLRSICSAYAVLRIGPVALFLVWDSIQVRRAEPPVQLLAPGRK
jgi:hypothetical protein